jgi:hypothetical protein
VLMDEVLRIHGRRKVERSYVFCPVQQTYLDIDGCGECDGLDEITVSDGDGSMRCSPQMTGAGWTGRWDAQPDG